MTDASQSHPAAAKSKLQELFDARTKDNRVQILNDVLSRRPYFAAWVNQADVHNVRSGKAESATSKGFRRPPPMMKLPFKKS